MIRRFLAEAISREIKGLGRLPWVLAIALLALLLPQISSAQELLTTSFSSPPGTPTIEISIGGNGRLIDRILVTDGVKITCGPFLYLYGSASYSVTVSQIQKNTVVSMNGLLVETILCDNAPHTYHALATVPNGGRPFRTGNAVVEVIVNQCGEDQNYQYVCVQGAKARGVNLR